MCSVTCSKMHGLQLVFAALTFTYSCYATTTQIKDFCKTPPPQENAMLEDWINETYAQGHSVRYKCFPGYVSLDSITMICSESKWILKSHSRACKKRSCGHPGSISFGSFELTSGDAFEFGAVIEYSCDEGYQMVSRHKTRECTATGWTKIKPMCEARLCPPLRDESLRVLSSVFDEEYTIGQVIRLQCRNPSHILDGPSEIFCTSYGTWNMDPPICRARLCPPLRDESLRVLSSVFDEEYTVGQVIRLQCRNPSHILDGPSEIFCTSYGTWNMDPPICREQQKKQISSCNEPPALSFGELLGEKKQIYISGSVLNIQCMNYYTLMGRKFIKCRNGAWDELPTCLEPCILHNTYIQGNNTRLAKASTKYVKHGQSVSFKCLPKFQISDHTLLKVNCNRGKILYPKCVKVEPCIVNENIMKENHILVKKENCHRMPESCRSKPIVHNKQVEFRCVPGYSISDLKELNVTCFDGAISYPQCNRRKY